MNIKLVCAGLIMSSSPSHSLYTSDNFKNIVMKLYHVMVSRAQA